MALAVVSPAQVSRLEPADAGPHAGELRRLTAPDLGPTLLLTAIALATLLVPSALSRSATVIAVVGILAGVPHGAIDHLVPLWSSFGPPAGRTGSQAAGMASFLVLYAASAVAVLAVLLLFPTPALASLLVLAALHFGRGEVVAWAARSGRPVPGFRDDLLPATAHGGVVVGMLLWAHPSATGPVLRELSPQLSAWALQSRTPGLVLVAALVILGVLDLGAHSRVRDTVDLLVLVVAFALAPPLIAFGCYFGGWHAVRHTGRLLDLARISGGGTRTWRAACRRLVTAALLPSAVALLVAAGLWWERSSIGLGALIAVLLALTVPHSGVVAALDRRDHLLRDRRLTAEQ